MGRRIQGFIHRVKHDHNQNKTEDEASKNQPEAIALSQQNENSINISKAQLVSGIVSGLAKAAVKPCPVQEDKTDTEISGELINMLVERVRNCQNQSNQTQNDAQPTNQKSDSEQNELQALVARLLLGNKGEQEKQQQNNAASVNNPILAANDQAQQNNLQQNQSYATDMQLKPNMTAKIASQVLAEAQYELSKELETSLNKLRQVIEESKQVAQKISNLLEQNQGGNNGNNQQN